MPRSRVQRVRSDIKTSMKKTFIFAGITGLLLGLQFLTTQAVSTLSSVQVGTNPIAGSVLQTNGATSTWVTTSSLGISGGGGSGTVGPASSTQVAFFNSSTTITGSSTFTFATTTYNTSTTMLSVIMFEGIANADQFPGSDIDAQIQNAYNALPSNGGQVFVPAGVFNASTSIVINTAGKVLNLVCAAGGGLYDNGGTVIHYTPSNFGTQFKYDVQNFVSAGTGIQNCNFIGPAGSGNSGSSVTSSSVAISIGGTNGAFGFNLQNVHVSGYGTDFYVGSNVAFLNIDKSVLNKAGVVFYAPQLNGGGENNRIANSVLADGNSATGSIADKCFNIQISGNTEFTLQNDSFDDCQEYSNQYGGTLNVIKNIANHYEDPNYGATGAYDFIQGISGQAGSFVIDDVGNDFQQDANSGLPNQYITSGGTFNSTDDNLQLEGGNGAVPVAHFVTAQDSNDITNIQGLTQNYGNTSAVAAVTYNVGTNLYAPNGLYYGNSLIYSQSTSTTVFGSTVNFPNLTIGKFLALDGNGNVVTTSTPSGSGGGLASTTPFSAGYLPVISSSGTLTNSVIYQNQNTGYLYSRSITVTSTGAVASGTNLNFPMLVSSTVASWATVANGGRIKNLVNSPTGIQEPADLVFATSTACSPLNFETESYTSSTGALVDWVNVPSVSTGTVIYACYGNSAVTKDQSHPSSTWNSNYATVYHFPTVSGALNASDSTSNASNGVINGGTQATVGEIDGAASTTGGAFVNVSVGSTVGIGNTNTYSAWALATSFNSTNDNILAQGNSMWLFTGNGSGGCNSNLTVYGSAFTCAGAPSMATGTWNMLTVTRAGTSTNGYIAYVNGVQVFATTRSSVDATGTTLAIGNRSDQSTSWNGKIDEVNVLTSVLTPQWILTQYNNQSSPSTFYAIGSESSLTNTNVGIGTTSPSSTLYVVGTSTISGNFSLNGVATFIGSSTIVTPSIGGTITSGGCDFATSSIDSSYTSSTTAFITTPQNDPGTTLGGAWAYALITAPGIMTTRVCANVTLTPSSTPYIVKIIK